MYVSIVIVNYRNYSLTERCVQSVLNNTPSHEFEIVIIDNNSPNESYKILNEKYKNDSFIKIIKNEENIGYGAAINKAVKKINSEYILILNPDVIVIDDAINIMLKKIAEDSNIGIIGCKLLNDDYSLQYSCRRILSMSELLKSRTPLSKLVNKTTVRNIDDKYLMKDISHGEEQEVDWVMGSCMLLSRETFNKVDGFSKEFFMYFEDVDLCHKIDLINKKVLYYPAAQMIHSHAQESKKKINKLTFIHLSSMIKFYMKNYRALL